MVALGIFLSNSDCKKEEISEGVISASPWQLFQQAVSTVCLRTHLLTVNKLLVSGTGNTDKSICRFQVLLFWFVGMYVCIYICLYETQLSFMARGTLKTSRILSQQI